MPIRVRIVEPGKTPPRSRPRNSWTQKLGWTGRTGIPPGDHTLARAELVYALFVLNLAAMVFCGLFPFNFGAQLGSFFSEVPQRFHWDFMGPNNSDGQFHLYSSLLSDSDLFQNIIFFMPFGFILGAIIGRRFFASWPKWIASLGVATLLSFCMTLFIEMSQVMLATRDSSESDLITNTLGGVLGFCLYRAVGEYSVELAATLWARARRLIDARACAVIGGVWLLAAIVLPLWAYDASGLDDWHSGYRICLGQEPKGEMKFTGRVGCLFLADRAATDAQVDRLFAGDDFASVIGHDSLLGAYRFHGSGPYADATDTLPPINWVGGAPPDVAGDSSEPATKATTAASKSPSPYSRAWADNFRGVGLYPDHWLRSAADMTKAVVPIRKNQAFTLMLDCQTLDPYMTGPARIATISADRNSRDFTIAQDADVLVVRINTPETGGNGTDPEFGINRVFTDPDVPHRIIVTYQRPTLRIYVDTPDRRHVSTLLPETMLINHLYPRSWRYPIGESGVELTPYVYRLCMLAPLGLLAAGATARLPRRRLAAAAGAIAAAIVLDTILQLLARDGFSVMRVLFAVGVCVTVAVIMPPPAVSALARPATA